MSGGKWTSQNKVRPAAYINFEAVQKGSMTVGDRGIVALELPLNWGEENKFIEVLSSDLLDGNSKKLVGFTAFDDESKLLRACLSYSYKALVFRTNYGGEKATATVDEDLVITAKCSGTLGNKITVSIAKNTSTNIYTVITYVDGDVMDTQKVAHADELVNNDFVIFEYNGEDNLLPEVAGQVLSGGTNGTVEESTYYTKYLALLKMAKYQVFTCFSSTNSVKSNVDTFIQQLRDEEGKYVQVVMANYDGADYEGIINSVSSVVINDETFTANEFVSVVAGMTAGANFNESNTAKIVKNATSIVNEMSDSEIKAALEAGKFVISTSTSGNIKVEQDINSLHTYGKTKNYNFKKNRVLRTMDEIGTTTKITWEDTYMGKVDNDATGRSLFKSDLVQYGNELQRLRGIQEFDATNITITQGNNLDAVVCDWNVKPVDSMEFLYMTVYINS